MYVCMYVKKCKNKVLLVELDMMKQRLVRTDGCCRIRSSQREQTSFWETQVSSNLVKKNSINMYYISLSRLCHDLRKYEHLLVSRMVGGSICISKEKQ